MAKDKRGDAVESFKLTPEQMTFQKKFGNIKKIGEVLNLRMFQLKQETEELKGLYQVLDQEAQNLSPPEESTFELDGMNFPEEQESAI